MVAKGLESCEHCGRMRWAADRFCAECGEAFAEPRTIELQEFDADALAPAAPLDADPDQAQRFPRSFVIAAGGLVALLLILGLFSSGTPDPDGAREAAAGASGVDLAPMSGFGGSPTVTPIPQFDDPEDSLTSDSGLPITPIPPRPDPNATSDAASSEAAVAPNEEGQSGDATRSSEEPPASRSALLDQLLDAELDLGATWIATLTDDHRPRVVNVETGEEVVLERTNQFGAPVFFESDGAYSVGVSGEQDSRSSWLSFQPWSEGETTASRLLTGDVVGTYLDPNRGTIVVSAPSDGASAGQALDLDQDTSVRFDLPSGATPSSEWARWTHPSFSTLDHIAASAGGQVWLWTWDAGWEARGAGELVVTGQDGVVTRHCEERLDSCAVEVRWSEHAEQLGAVPVNADWRMATFEDPTSHVPVRLALSGDSLLGGGSSGGATIISLWDLNEYTTLEVGLDTEQVFWMDYSPNGRYLIVSSSTGTSIVDAESGDLVLVNRRSAGEINGLSPTPLVFLDDIER